MQRLDACKKEELLASVVGGFFGGLAGAFAMEQFQRSLGRLFPEVGGVPGAGGQQYRRPQSEPSTYQAADVVATATTGKPLTPSAKPAAASAIHYAFGGSVGAIYGAAATRTPDLASAGGIPFGATVWLIADELGMPLSGLAKRPTRYPLEDHLTTFVSHLIYGATTDAVRRLFVRNRRR